MSSYGKIFLMNQLMAELLGLINGVLAITIIGISILGGFYSLLSGNGIFSFIFVILAGVVIASLVCGLIAILISIKDDLDEIKKKL